MADADHFRVVRFMAACAAHELDIAIRIVDEKQNRMSVRNMIADKRRFVIVEDVACELNHDCATRSA